MVISSIANVMRLCIAAVIKSIIAERIEFGIRLQHIVDVVLLRDRTLEP